MKWTVEKINQFVFMKQQGLSLAEIADELGCTFEAAKSKNKKLIDQGVMPKASRGGSRKRGRTKMEKKETAAAKFEKAIEAVGGFTDDMAKPITNDAAPVQQITNDAAQAQQVQNDDAQAKQVQSDGINSFKAVELINQCLKLADAAGIAITSLHIDVGDCDLELFGGSNPSRGSVVGVNEDGYNCKIDCHK